MGALLGNVATAIIGGNKQAKAIDKASDAQAAATQQAINLQRDIYNQNVGLQSPFYNTGVGAMNHMNALLGIQVPNAMGQAASSGGGIGGGGQTEDQWAESILNNGSLRSEINPSVWSQVASITDPSDKLAALEPLMFRKDREVYGQVLNSNPRPATFSNAVTEQAPVNGTPNSTTPMTANAAYDAFKNYTGYTSRLNEANNAMNSAYAARGTLQSGAAMQAMAKMNQDYASGEFGNYMGYLGGQQQLGYGAANALSGVGTNYANAAGNMYMQNGNNMANAAIARGNNSVNTLNSVNSSFNQAAGMMMGMMSDRRLKKDVIEIAKRKDGLTLVEWTYKFDPEARRYQGFMADEVKEIYPDAYIANYNGTEYAGVNYAAIPREAA
jgi:hypothetical protein